MKRTIAKNLAKKILYKHFEAEKIYREKEEKTLDRALFLGLSTGYLNAAREVYFAEKLGEQVDFVKFFQAVRSEYETSNC